MPVYVIEQKKENYVRIKVEAKNKKEAIQKAWEGEFDHKKDIIEDEYLLPGSDWITTKVKKIAPSGSRALPKRWWDI